MVRMHDRKRFVAQILKLYPNIGLEEAKFSLLTSKSCNFTVCVDTCFYCNYVIFSKYR